MTDFEKYLNEQMKNPEVLAEMEALEPEMEAVRAQLDALLEAEGSSEWRWALVGNVVESHLFGEEHEVRFGAKAFRSGAKLYVAPPQWGDGFQNVVVIGRPRRYRGFIEMVIRSELIENFRLKKVFDPAVLRKMRESEHIWWDNSDKDKEIILASAESINSHRATEVPQDTGRIQDDI